MRERERAMGYTIAILHYFSMSSTNKKSKEISTEQKRKKWTSQEKKKSKITPSKKFWLGSNWNWCYRRCHFFSTLTLCLLYVCSKRLIIHFSDFANRTANSSSSPKERKIENTKEKKTFAHLLTYWIFGVKRCCRFSFFCSVLFWFRFICMAIFLNPSMDFFKHITKPLLEVL